MAEIDRIRAIKQKVKHGKLKIERKDIKAQLTKNLHKTDKEREEICKKARKKAHRPVANMRREMSNEIRSGLNNTLSEGYDFIEESYGSGMPSFMFYDEPQISENISESFSKDNKFKMIGVAEGVFAPIGVMSRNNRMYDNDHYDYLLENQMLVDKISHRGMLGTIGHHDKKVDDDDLANGDVSHIVTDLHIQEEADGTRNLIGRLEILNTPAGNLLKTYYDSGMPLYVSSRGAGRLLPVANESYKRVDKTNYYLETFDIVRDPGFLGAKPKYVTESLDENHIDGDNDMGKEKVTPAISTDMETEAIVNKMLHPLQEQLAELADAVKMLADKVLDEEKTDEAVDEVSEECDACAEPKHEVEDDQKEEKAPVAPEVVEGTKEEAVVEEKEDEAEEAEEAEEETNTKKAKEEAEDKEEIEESAEVSEECDKKETEETEEEKVEESAEETVVEEVVEEKAEEAVEETVTEEAVEEVVESAEEVKEEKVEESAEETVVEEVVEEKAEEVTEGCDCEDEDDEDDEDEEIEESSNTESNEEAMKELLKIVEDATNRTKEVLEKYNSAIAELNAYKLSEEFSITVDEAKAKLAESSVESIREELAKAEETPIEKEPEDAATEEVAPVAEAKKPVKGVFSCFASLNESNSKKGVFSVFKNI